VRVAFAACAGFDIELEIRKSSRCFLDVRQRGFGQRSAAEIRMKDNSGCVDYRTQRVGERLTQLLFDGVTQTVKCDSQRGCIQQAGGNFFAQAGQHDACGGGDSGSSMFGCEPSHGGRAN